ncbi:hypothetical protein OPQ81_000719 [Rhizoctonia solani]|nr:hypothetical protein OPQ81_000719 [Rhizoctonia solani]
MNVSNSRALSAGVILWPPSYLEHSLQTAQSNIQIGARGPDNLCEITEEYRIGNAFDILASIGGLLALFQGMHVLCFGRPLFWGLFGAKLISPFGIFGKCTGDREFRRRLRERYHRPIAAQNTHSGGHQVPDEESVNISRFLLDFVIDMGPASIPPQTTVRDRSDSSPEPPSTSLRVGEGQAMESSMELTLLRTGHIVEDQSERRERGV